jgi:hypothetical protein
MLVRLDMPSLRTAIEATSTLSASTDSPTEQHARDPSAVAGTGYAAVFTSFNVKSICTVLQNRDDLGYGLRVWKPSLSRNVPLLLLVLNAANLLIGYSTGMHRSWSRPPGASSSAT